jgi:DNA-binding MltR family transcriptional regulator
MPKRREPLSFEQVKDIFAEFQVESDRAAAILSVALLDAQLEEILTSFGADEPSLVELLKPDQPIGSLSARRKLCLALGLISPDEAAELSILGKIRNEFAHQLHGQGFDIRPIVDWVQSLEVPQRVFPRAKFESRPRFMTSVAFMHLLLVWRLEAAKAAKRTPSSKAEIHLHPISKDDFDRMLTDT